MSRLLLLSLLFSGSFLMLRAQEKDISCFTAVALNSKTNEYEPSLSQFRPADLYLAGEVHGIASNLRTAQSLIQLLHAHFGVRNILWEGAYSASFLINRYLQSGDTSILQSISGNSLTQSFFRQLRQYCLNTRQELPIRFWGLDFEIDRGRHLLYIRAMELLFRDKEIPATIREQLNYALQNPSEKAARSLNNLFQKQLEESGAFYKTLLQADYDDFYTISSRGNHFTMSRDEDLYRNFQALKNRYLAAEDTAPRFFAQFGYAHVNPGYKQSLRNLLLQKEHQTIYTIGYHYFDCAETTANGNVVQIADFGAVTDSKTATHIHTILSAPDAGSASHTYALIPGKTCYPDIRGLDLIYIFLKQDALTPGNNPSNP